jgi:hypothetical protein
MDPRSLSHECECVVQKVIEDHYVRPTKSHRKFTRICKFNDNCFMCFNQAYVNSTIIVSFVSTSNIVAKHLHMLDERWYDEIRVGSYCYFVFLCGRRGLYIVHICLVRNSGGLPLQWVASAHVYTPAYVQDCGGYRRSTLV